MKIGWALKMAGISKTKFKKFKKKIVDNEK